IHAQSISEIAGARLVAVSDVVEKNAVALAERFGAEPYTDYKKMLQRDDIHAVSLCVPSGMRAEIAEDCAKAGKHILAEKPLEVNSERIERLIKAVDVAGVKLGCIFQYRFAEGAQAIRKALDDGRFGKLVMGDAYIKWFRSQEYYDSGAWRGTRKLDGGGVLMNQGIHQIDLLVWFMGPVKSVVAQTALVGHTGLEVEDLACAMLTFENGAMGVIEGTTATWPGHAARVEVHGTEGSAVLEDGKLIVWKFKEERPEDEKILAQMGQESALGSGAGDPLTSLKHEGHRRQIEDFVNAIREDRMPLIDGRDGRRSVEVIEAIYRSAAAGKPVQLS
ncbi:MAG: Gfo/Idh/MocA family oxidoreductase, partial [Candidatus Hydrogenedentales bacterium]